MHLSQHIKQRLRLTRILPVWATKGLGDPESQAKKRDRPAGADQNIGSSTAGNTVAGGVSDRPKGYE